MSRYADLFRQLEKKNEGAFIPFLMLGDPTPHAALELIESVIDAGADALELGIGFSDPVADGPVIMDAHLRALSAGDVVESALEQIATIRRRHPQIPIGLLTYANMVFSSSPDEFYRKLADAGVDSILVADCPVREGDLLRQIAHKNGIAQIFIAEPDIDDESFEQLMTCDSGYIYMVSRPGVTGKSAATLSPAFYDTVRRIKERSPIPLLQGFGIRTPRQVHHAMESGLDGVFCGSALVDIVAKHCVKNSESGTYDCDLPAAKKELSQMTTQMKAATGGRK